MPYSAATLGSYLDPASMPSPLGSESFLGRFGSFLPVGSGSTTPPAGAPTPADVPLPTPRPAGAPQMHPSLDPNTEGPVQGPTPSGATLDEVLGGGGPAGKGPMDKFASALSGVKAPTGPQVKQPDAPQVQGPTQYAAAPRPTDILALIQAAQSQRGAPSLGALLNGRG